MVRYVKISLLFLGLISMFTACSAPLEFEIISQKTFKDGFRKKATTVFKVLFINTTGSPIRDLEIRLKTCDGKVLSPVFHSDLYDNLCHFAITPGFGFLRSGETTCEIDSKQIARKASKLITHTKSEGSEGVTHPLALAC